MADVSTVDEAVTPIRTALEADGYELRVEEGAEGLVLRIVAGPDACEDCLVPPAVMRPMIGKVLEDAGADDLDFDLIYPTD